MECFKLVFIICVGYIFWQLYGTNLVSRYSMYIYDDGAFALKLLEWNENAHSGNVW